MFLLLIQFIIRSLALNSQFSIFLRCYPYILGFLEAPKPRKLIGAYLYYILKGIPNVSVTGVQTSCHCDQPLNRSDVEQCLKERRESCYNCMSEWID